MKIHGLCVVKNERDIIEQMLRSAAQWCDHIYVLDNGSDDGTWELVQQLSRELTAVRPFKQDPKPFTDSIRDDILLAYKAQARPGDWWCILDADEFYIDEPRAFLKAVPRSDRAVYRQTYSYLFTDKDLERYREDPEAYGDAVPVEQKLRYYAVGEYTELRFFRHSRALKRVPMAGCFPIHPRRIRLRHYAYRSPGQIATRMAVRHAAMLRGEFVHEKKSNWSEQGVAPAGAALECDIPQSWEERVVSHVGCHYDALDGVYADGVDWTPPHAPGWTVRIAKRADRIARRAFSAPKRALARLAVAFAPASPTKA